MAEIILALGTSHTPQLSACPENWEKMGANDPRIKSPEMFEAMATEKAEWLTDQLTLEVYEERHAKVWKAINRMQTLLAEAAPDVVVTIGDDQKEAYSDNHSPGIDIYWGEDVLQGTVPEDRTRNIPWREVAFSQFHPDEPTVYPCQAELGEYLIRSLITDGFDVSHTKAFQTGQRIGHAFGFVYKTVMADHVVPQLPVMINTFYPPNQPTVGRCYDLGKAIGRAISSWDKSKRVALVASGGLSHMIVDESLDYAVLEAIQKKDKESLTSLDEGLFVSGTSEIKNWVAVTGAMEETDCTMDVIDYIPMYRSRAGTGVGAGFAAWQ